MAFLSSLDIAASGMTAQKKRLDIIAENITNSETLRTENGGPYRRKLSVFREIPNAGSSFYTHLHRAVEHQGDGYTKGGVMVSEIIEDPSEFIPVYDPGHPDANEEGYVMKPNVDVTLEMVDAMAATRSFSSNLSAFEAMKTMAQTALDAMAR